MRSLQQLFQQYGNYFAIAISILIVLWAVGTQLKFKNKKRRRLYAECEKLAQSGVVKPHEFAEIQRPPFLHEGIDGTVYAHDQCSS